MTRARCNFSVGRISPALAVRLSCCLSLIAFAHISLVNVAQGVDFVVMSGVDTILPSGSGLNGPDAPHGAAGQNPDGLERWEWDGSDGGGENLGLLWFDIPAEAISQTVVSATLKLHIENEGDGGIAHRVTEDWLSGPNGGDNVTYNNMPGGPGVTPGTNARSDVSFTTPFQNDETTLEVDVTSDVQAWASGEANYGWVFFGSGGNGVGVASFENVDLPVPMLTITAIPEPSTLVLALLGVVAFLTFGVRRRMTA